MKKSIIAINLVLILFSFMAYAGSTDDLTLKLDRNVYGPEQNFDGSMAFNMEGAVQGDAIIGLVVDGEPYGKSFIDAMKSVSKGTLLAQSFELSSRESAISMPFSSAGDNYIGIDFKDAKTIKSIDFDVKAASAISDLKIDFKNDNSTDWIYRGDPLPGSFPATRNIVFVTDDSYLENFESVGVTSYVEDKTFCEKVKINPSNEYYIESMLGNENPGGRQIGQLYGVIMRDVTKPLGTLDATDCYDKINNNESKYFCCKLNPTSSTPNAQYCKIDYSFDKDEDVFACVFQSLPAETDPGVYSIAQEAENDGTVKAYYNGKDAKTAFLKEDYMIRVYSHKFNTKLNTGEIKHVTLDTSAVSKAKIKAGQELVIKVSSSSAGNVRFENLKAEINLLSGAGSRIVGFNPVTVYSERINYTGKVAIPLSFFDNAITPADTGSDYSVYAAIQETEDDEIISETVDFSVIEGPEAKIKVDNPLPSVGDIIKFDGSDSVPRTIEKNQSVPIITYKWNFGDNITAEGVTAAHSFSKERSYDIILSIIDKDKIGGRAVLTIKVEPISGSIIEQISKSIAFVDNAEVNIEKSEAIVKDTADVLGVTGMFSAVKANLTALLDEAEAINDDEEMNDSEKNARFVDIKKELEEMMNDIPVRFDVSVVRFDAKVNDAGDVPSAKELQLSEDEQFKERVVKAQEDVDVKGESRKVSIEYKSGDKEELALIKKTIIRATGTIYEKLPSGMEKEEILTEGYELVASDGSIFKFDGGIGEIVYTASGDIDMAIEAKTFVVPADLSEITVEKEELKEVEAVCGNDKCEPGESKTCPKDCPKETPWAFIIPVIIAGLLAIGAVYYFMVYKKQHPKPGAARALFKTDKDYEAVKKYVEDAIHIKGFNEQQIGLVLKKKGWRDEQINGVVLEVKAEKPKKGESESKKEEHKPIEEAK